MTQTERRPDSNKNDSEKARWAAAMQQLAHVAETLPSEAEVSRSRADEVFADRALALAAPLTEERQDARLDLIAFDVATQRVALEARYVYAVIGLSEPTSVLGAPDHLAGVVNFRGVILPVFRLERCLGSDEVEYGGRTIVLGELRPEFAFFAHAVEEISGFSAAELRTASGQGAAGTLATLGVTDGAVNVLDGGALLSDQRFHVGQKAAAHI
jgi:purine-binding chemotaxis protein CheW